MSIVCCNDLLMCFFVFLHHSLIGMYYTIERDIFNTIHKATSKITRDIDGHMIQKLENISGADEPTGADVTNNRHHIQKQAMKVNGLYIISNVFIEHGGSKEDGLEYFRKEIQKHEHANKEEVEEE